MNFLTRLGPGSSPRRAESQLASELGELPLLGPRRAAMQRLPWLTAAAAATVGRRSCCSQPRRAVGRRSEQRSATAAAAAAAGVDAVIAVATVPGTV